MTPRLDNIDAQSLLGNLFASFLIASFHFFSLCLYSQIEHSLPFMHRLIQHLEFVFTRHFFLFAPVTSLIVFLVSFSFSQDSAPPPISFFTRSFSSLSLQYFAAPREPTWYKAYSIITSHEQRNASTALFHHFWSLKYLASLKSLRAD